MKILVIGGAGYIGGVTTHMLVEQSYDVTVFDDLSSGLESNIPKTAKFIKGDVTVENDVKKAFENNSYDLVMHFAAKIMVPESMEKPYEYLRVNSFGVLNVSNLAVKNGVKNYLLSSTAAVYGIPKIFPITEDTLPSPVNPYGESKLIAEHILSSFEEAIDLNWAALRYFNVAGAYSGVGPDYPFVSHIIPMLLDRARKDLPFSINGNDYDTPDGTCVRDYVHVADIGRAHVLAAEKMVSGKQKMCQAINLGSNSGYSVKEIVDKFLELTGKKLDVSYSERRAGDPDKLVASNQKAKTLLGWQPELDLQSIIRDHARWYDKLPNSARAKSI